MTRTVDCVVLKTQAEGLDRPPFPGELGERIYANVSKDGWKQWLQQLQMVINENQLNTAHVADIEKVETLMKSFFFEEGGPEMLPPGFRTGAPPR